MVYIRKMTWRSKFYFAIFAGVGGGVGLYWYLSSRKKKVQPKVDLRIETTEPPAETENISSPESPVFREILNLLSRVTLDSSPEPETLTQLASMLSSLTESELSEIKLSSDYVSFMISEWIFYHTLRTSKSVTWNSNTGLIDQVLSPQERELGNRIASTMRRAYWDKHLEDLSRDPPNYMHVVDRLVELQSRINEFQKNSKLHLQFDLELIRQLIANKEFDWNFFLSLVKRAVEAMHDLESPAAHEDTIKYFERIQSSVEIDSKERFHAEIIECLGFLFSQLDLLESELAYFRSSQLAMESKRKKERAAFSTLLSEHLVSGHRLREILLSEISPESRSTNFGSLTSAIVVAFKKIIVQATMRDPHVKVPESMNPDLPVLKSFRKRRESISLVASFLVGFHSQLSSIVGESSSIMFLRQDVEVINRLVHSLSENASQGGLPAMISQLETSLESFTGKPLSSKQRFDLGEAAEKCCGDSSQLRTLLDQRVFSLIQSGVTDSSSSVISTALGSRPWFLSICAKDTSSLINDMIEFLAEHLHVYLPVYRDLVTSAI